MFLQFISTYVEISGSKIFANHYRKHRLLWCISGHMSWHSHDFSGHGAFDIGEGPPNRVYGYHVALDIMYLKIGCTTTTLS